MGNTGVTILITSNEPWGSIWFSKHHYANELSKLGYEVYFLNPVKKWSISNIFSFKINIENVSKNLNIVNYKNNFPVKLFPVFFTRINDNINERKLLRQINTKSIIWWKFDAFRFLKNKTGKSIYHVVDPYRHFWQDKHLAKESDLIVCTNPKFIPFYKPQNYNTLFVPHGISTDEFNVNEENVNNIRLTYDDFALIIGTIYDDFDFELMQYLAQNNIKILIIGKENNHNALWPIIKQHKNVNYLGVMHAKDLKDYTAASKVCLVVYKPDSRKEFGSRSPLKIMNYIAQNKPVITSFDLEINELNNFVIYKADNYSVFLELVRKAKKNEIIVDKDKISNYLYRNIYTSLIKKIINKIG